MKIPKETFRMRKEPREPKRPEKKMIKVGVEIEDGWSLIDLANAIPKEYRDIAIFSAKWIEEDCYDCGSGYTETYFTYERLENDAEFERRMRMYERNYLTYEEKMRDYNKWYLQNETNIKDLLAKKKEKAQNIEAKKVAKLEKQLQKAKEKLEKIK